MWMLAQKILLHDRVKFLVAAAGVSVSVTLVLVQIGLFRGFMESTSLPIDHSTADIWVTSRGTEGMDFALPLDERSFYRVSSVEGVERAERFIIAFTNLRLPSGGIQGVEVIGLEDRGELLRPWDVVTGDPSLIRDYDGVVVDEHELGRLGAGGLGDRSEIGELRAKIVALTSGVRNFTTTPFVFTNLDSARAYGRMPHDRLSYVLVKVHPGYDVPAIRNALNQLPHLEAYTRGDFSQRARDYWEKRTGVGVGFYMTAVMGVIVGLVVVGQILYNGTLEHLKEYGTLKAMGATNGSVIAVILYQALISAVVGYIAGAGLAFVACEAAKHLSLKMVITSDLLIETGMVTVVMCSAASMLSVIKVLKLDPASVFKG
jgi:putative ABC transport system permease protein